MTTHTWDRVPAIVSFPNPSKYTESYGFAGTSGLVHLEGQYLIPAGKASKTLFLFMHPTTTLQLLPMPTSLAAAGLHVLCAASRYPKNDAGLIMENVAVDMGAWIRDAREKRGYEKVVLVGWSGGGSLSLFYQAQAEHPTITATPAGDPIDLAAAKLLPADGIIFIAAHLSRAQTLTEWIDPSVLDEADPDRRDRELDIYAAGCPNAPPFTPDFIARFRAAQIARNRKITAWCQDWLETLRKRGGSEIERAFVVHRTMCDVRWIDPTVDPNGRKPNWCFLGDPRTVNVAPVGLARYSSLRSWLSQWSYDLSNANGPKNAALVKRVPVLQIENLMDDAVPRTHNPIIRAALATPDKEYVGIEGANHYYRDQPDLLRHCIAAVLDWSRRKNLLAG
ncbi:MAG: alpha/beta hydrolase [Alphaproteobacteria bacterium]|nr:alpha/beta hydrolase [Alphaproteobacteria bacterium]